MGRRASRAATELSVRAFSIADAEDVVVDRAGSRFRWRDTDFSIALPGRHNVINALAAAHVGVELGVPLPVIADGLAALRSVPGRFELDRRRPGLRRAVDYAHTPDALAAAIATRTARSPGDGRVLVVFGCGGDRDRAKRPRWARIAAAGADLVVVTSDNPRSEDPEAIVAEVLAGVPHERSRGVRPSSPTAAEAIAHARRTSPSR